MAPIIVIWFGFGLSSKIIITATIAFFPLLANTIVGLRSAPLDQIELMVAFTATRWQTFRMVRFPQALPYIFLLIRDTPSKEVYVLNMFRMRGSRL